MNLKRHLIGVAIFAAAALASYHAYGADVHVCSTVEPNLGIVYDKFDKASSAADLNAIAQGIAASPLPDEQKGVLLAGLQFLYQVYNATGGKVPAREAFIAEGKNVCEANFGQIEDAKHI
jgi:hypothetical protein